MQTERPDMKLTTAIRKLAKARGRDRTQGSSFERLAAYHERRLSEPEMEEVRDELARMPESAEIIADLERLDAETDEEDAAGMTATEMEQGYSAVMTRLAERDGRAATEPRVVRRSWIRRPWLAAAVAAAVPLIVLSLWVVRLEQQLARRLEPTTVATIVELSSADEQVVRSIAAPDSDGVDAEPGPSWAGRQGYIVLIIGTSSLERTPRYSLELLKASDHGGRTVWHEENARRDAAGSFQLVLPWRYVEPGEYRLIVRGHGSGLARTLADYEVRFE